MPKIPFPLPLLATCLWLSACEQKPSAQVDPAQQKALQEMQARIDGLSSRAEQLNQQLADQKEAGLAAKQAELEKLQADLQDQRDQLAQQQRAVQNSGGTTTPASTTPASTTPASSERTTGTTEPASFDLFYDRLQDDGAWIQTNDYGYIWQPNAARRSGWRPYTDGHWVQTDRGWTWFSNEPFGWATYHYGRWVEITDLGWCWLPGTEWSPGWVSWRSNDEYVGWAPLPPEARVVEGGPGLGSSIDVEYGTGPDYYTFVETAYFGEPTYVGHFIDPVQNLTIINQTRNVTRIYYNKTVIYNEGPDLEVIRRHTRRPVDHFELALNRDNERNASTGPVTRGNVLTVLAPLIQKKLSKNDGSPQQPRKVEQRLSRAVQDKGWKNYGPEQVRQTRENLQRQSENSRPQNPDRHSSTNPANGNSPTFGQPSDAPDDKRGDLRDRLQAQRENRNGASTPAPSRPGTAVPVQPGNAASTPAERPETRQSLLDAAKARLQERKNGPQQPAQTPADDTPPAGRQNAATDDSSKSSNQDRRDNRPSDKSDGNNRPPTSSVPARPTPTPAATAAPVQQPSAETTNPGAGGRSERRQKIQDRLQGTSGDPNRTTPPADASEQADRARAAQQKARELAAQQEAGKQQAAADARQQQNAAREAAQQKARDAGARQAERQQAAAAAQQQQQRQALADQQAARQQASQAEQAQRRAAQQQTEQANQQAARQQAAQQQAAQAQQQARQQAAQEARAKQKKGSAAAATPTGTP